MVTSDITVREMIDNPAFGDFGHLLFPVDRPLHPDMTLTQVTSPDIYLWYHFLDVNTSIDVMDTPEQAALQGDRVFLRFYDEKQRQEDPAKTVCVQRQAGREKRNCVCGRGLLLCRGAPRQLPAGPETFPQRRECFRPD